MTSFTPRTDGIVPPRQRLKLAVLGLALLLGACASAPPPHPTAPVTTARPASPPPAPSVRAPSADLPAHAPLSDIALASATPPPVVMLSAPTDIWDRIRRGLAMSDLDNDMVRDREQWYASRPDYIQRMTERSSRYLFHIVEEIERRNLPMELALLPFIESAFNPQAVSSARAAGMWQFMPATGQSFDLKQNVFRDDRRDVLASTRAALDYLEQLHARFGDWHLALAAYNWGQGNVNKAITRNQRAGLPATYNDINMPLETRMYVPKLQAVENIVARPEAFSAQLPLIGNHPFFDTVTLERDMDVTLIAGMAGISEKDFRSLNPSIKQPLVMAAGTPNILLPWDNAKVFEDKLKGYRGQLASWTAWVAPTTMSVAEVADRVGMSESELREVNNIPPRMKVRAGSSLLVPRSGQRNNDVSEFVADNAQLSLAPDIILKRSTVRARKGDNLARLAQRYGVSAASAAGWNRMSVNERLKTGQRITLMLPRSVKLASGSAPSRKSAAVSVRKKGREGKATARAEKRAGKPVKQAQREKPVRQSQAKSKRAGVKVAAEGKNGRKARKN
ncbi:MAG: transglycosylase SLT domain-containing protein [Hydrogenophaga sp.]|uniref:transglycosylase SLT domain-containing protein n=1 Tax=Hydrogenophaga sp. TaxID=1904254 RepID=UPI0025BAE945|nr:transglycosylase SLT domain-containing protein [Hydrogenophaga sp.]MBT9549652.1 transglycosylase SLT domain-containing protein [Hydrogenophaga sp.]